VENLSVVRKEYAQYASKLAALSERVAGVKIDR
jgi:hypothetical protein